MTKKQWDKSFSTEEYVYGTIANEFVIEKSDLLDEGSKVACFAEGEGRNAVYLASLGHEVTAYDQSTVGLQKAEQLAMKNNVTIKTIEQDLTKEIVGTHLYDAVVLVFAHVPAEDQSFLFEQAMDAVKPGGYLIVEVYSKQQLSYKTGGPPSIDRLYDPRDLLHWTKQLKILHFYYGEAVRDEGFRHTGLCHVIQLAAQK